MKCYERFGVVLERQSLRTLPAVRESCVSSEHFHTGLISLSREVSGKGMGSSFTIPDSKVHVANMGPTWVLSAPDGPHVGPMDLAIRDVMWDAVGIVLHMASYSSVFSIYGGWKYSFHVAWCVLKFMWRFHICDAERPYNFNIIYRGDPSMLVKHC